MEGRRDGFTGAAAPQGLYGRRGGGGGSGDESDDGSSSGVELSLRLTTGSSPRPPAAEQQEAAARRSMTLFYDGRVCAVDVTEMQAREIISMANQQLRRNEGHLQDRAGGATPRCGGQARPAAAFSPPPVGRLRAPVTDQAGLSMKRSLQQFLQKREARRVAAVAPPYAGGGRQAQTMRH